MGAMSRTLAAALPVLLLACSPRRALPPDASASQGAVATVEVSPSAATLPERAPDAATVGLDAEIVDVGLVAECGGERAHDPLAGGVVVSYANEHGEAGALEVVRSEVVFASALEGWVFPVELTPSKSVVTGAHAKQRVTHARTGRSGGAAMLCSLCGQTGKLSMTWRAPDGAEQSGVRDFTLECAQLGG
jgi:hypothetical protein